MFACVLLVLGLPYTAAAGAIGLKPMPWNYLAVLGGILASYALSAELLKRWLFGLRHEAGPSPQS